MYRNDSLNVVVIMIIMWRKGAQNMCVMWIRSNNHCVASFPHHRWYLEASGGSHCEGVVVSVLRAVVVCHMTSALLQLTSRCCASYYFFDYYFITLSFGLFFT